MLIHRGSEPLAEEAVHLICETGGLAVLAHPWALKNPVPIIRSLKEAGLHGMEVYRSDGRLAGISLNWSSWISNYGNLFYCPHAETSLSFSKP